MTTMSITDARLLASFCISPWNLAVEVVLSRILKKQEDPACDMKVLNVTRDDHVITIASAGETVHSIQLKEIWQ